MMRRIHIAAAAAARSFAARCDVANRLRCPTEGSAAATIKMILIVKEKGIYQRCLPAGQ
jgi:hypothetical protein